LDEFFHRIKAFIAPNQNGQAQTTRQIVRLFTANGHGWLLSFVGGIYFFSFSTSLSSRKSDSHLKTCIQVITATPNSTPATSELFALLFNSAKIIPKAHKVITTAHQNRSVRLRAVLLIKAGLIVSSAAAWMNASSALSKEFIKGIAAVMAPKPNGGNPIRKPEITSTSPASP
jgi:hypothetical protein